jgi:hypothetical protein
MNNEKEKVKGMTLESLWDICYRAHYHTSFSPDIRATQYVKEYSELLDSDLKELGDNVGNYASKFIEKFTLWMHAKASCISSMITGGSNFPIARAEKANNRERSASENFFKWREKYFKAVNRQRTLSPEEELDDALMELDKHVILQEQMKLINKTVRKFVGKENFEQNVLAAVEELGFSEKIAVEATKPDVFGHYGFAQYQLTNNNAKIKRLQEKVTIMKARISRKEAWEDIKFNDGYVTIEDDRIKIYHEQKPEQSIIDEIKKNGFRWSPYWKCWCRKHTGNAIHVTKNLTFIKPFIQVQS